MIKKALAIIGIAAVVGAIAPLQAAGPTGVACKITGTATLSPGLTTKAQTISFTFSGRLTPCKSTDATLKSGNATASGSGKFSCASGNGTGSGTAVWNNGKTSTTSFTVKGVGNVVVIQGKVTSGEFASGAVTSGVEAVLAFVTGQAAACTKSGITSLPFNGEIGIGNAK